MTYFNPKIYNKENLKEADRHELEWWYSYVMNAIDFITYETEGFGDSTLQKLKDEIISGYVKGLKEHIALCFNDLIVGTIENYDDKECEEVEEYTRFGDELDDEEE